MRKHVIVLTVHAGVCSAQVAWDGHAFRHLHTGRRLVAPSSALPSAPLPSAASKDGSAGASAGRQQHLRLNLTGVQQCEAHGHAAHGEGGRLAFGMQDRAEVGHAHAQVRPVSARPASRATWLAPAGAGGLSARRPASARRLLSHTPYNPPYTDKTSGWCFSPALPDGKKVHSTSLAARGAGQEGLYNRLLRQLLLCRMPYPALPDAPLARTINCQPEEIPADAWVRTC